MSGFQLKIGAKSDLQTSPTEKNECQLSVPKNFENVVQKNKLELFFESGDGEGVMGRLYKVPDTRKSPIRKSHTIFHRVKRFSPTL